MKLYARITTKNFVDGQNLTTDIPEQYLPRDSVKNFLSKGHGFYHHDRWIFPAKVKDVYGEFFDVMDEEVRLITGYQPRDESKPNDNDVTWYEFWRGDEKLKRGACAVLHGITVDVSNKAGKITYGKHSRSTHTQ